jgi:hypothetical protein
MKRTLFAIFLSVCLFFWSIARLHAEAARTNDEKHIEKVKISREDRQVIQNMELLTMMEFLKDMEIMEGKMAAAGEDKRK